MSLAWRFPHSARLDSTHAGLPLDACDVPAATSNHSHPAFPLVVEDVFVSFPAGYGVHVFQHGFSVHMSHLHSRKDTVSMHLHALSWFCSSLVAAANWRFKVLRSSFSTATLSAAAGGAAAAAAFASAADMALKAGKQQACSTQTACSPQGDPVFSFVLAWYLLFTPVHDPRNMATRMWQNGHAPMYPDSIAAPWILWVVRLDVKPTMVVDHGKSCGSEHMSNIIMDNHDVRFGCDWKLKNISNVNVDSEDIMISPWDGSLGSLLFEKPMENSTCRELWVIYIGHQWAHKILWNRPVQQRVWYQEYDIYPKSSWENDIKTCPKILSKSSVSCLPILFSSLKLLPILENVHKTNRTLADWSIPRLVQ